MDCLFCLKSLNFLNQAKWLACSMLAMIAAPTAWAHQPYGENMPVHPRIGTNVIPPLGHHLPSYRERFNRPTYIGGKIAYWISPTSQEAMNWHRSVHQGLYSNHSPWTENRYFYPKPWEVLTVGPRVPVNTTVQNRLESTLAPATVKSRPSSERDTDGKIKLAPTIESLPAPIP